MVKGKQWRIIWNTSGVSPPRTHILHEHILKSNNVRNVVKENTAGTKKKKVKLFLTTMMISKGLRNNLNLSTQHEPYFVRQNIYKP